MTRKQAIATVTESNPGMVFESLIWHPKTKYRAASIDGAWMIDADGNRVLVAIPPAK